MQDGGNGSAAPSCSARINLRLRFLYATVVAAAMNV